uniref:ER membrane protein complex subunit 7-like protein n=1 Tax=Dichanthelium oligosanthes TaxID=888268 RepID=A0A1E5VGS2_9POAL
MRIRVVASLLWTSKTYTYLSKLGIETVFLARKLVSVCYSCSRLFGITELTGANAKGFGLPAKTANTKVILNGAGTHLIEVSSIGYFFSPVRVDISARNPGYIQAALTETRRVLNELVLEPLKEEQYYEVREPFSVMSLLKSPMGLMVGFMVLMVFVMPKMMENIDPEEMKQAEEQMRNSPVSFSNLLSRTQG